MIRNNRIITKVKNKILSEEDKHFLREKKRFLEYSLVNKNESNVEYVCTNLRILTHDIEKGLSLPEPRKGFGKEKINKIIRLLKAYEEINDVNYDNQAYENAKKILQTYINYADEYELDITQIKEYFSDKNIVEESNLGVAFQSKSDVEQKSKLDFFEFSKSRHSLRIFSQESIDNRDLEKAIELAQTAPSACNRQSIKTYIINNKDICKKLLEIHGGAKGFSEVPCIIMVAGSLSSYTYINECSTVYVDGGIFIMNLLNSLHYYNFASCPLIWDDNSYNKNIIRNILDIPERDVIVGWIAVGRYPEGTHKYAVSSRKKIEDIAIYPKLK